MSYFSRRNNHVVEFSGYEEVSNALRARLLDVLRKHVDYNGPNYGMNEPWHVEPDEFGLETRKEFPGKDPFELVEIGKFHEVFTVVEIFLDLAREIYYTPREQAPREIQQALNLSGSVYGLNDRRIELKVEEDLAKKIEATKNVLANSSSAHDKFFEAIGNLFGRKAKPEDIVKDIFVAFEGYLKERTGSKDYGGAIDNLAKSGVISVTQKALLDKIYAYRSDTYGVGHAGNAKQPGEVDALWFVETVVAQLLFLDRKLKQKS